MLCVIGNPYCSCMPLEQRAFSDVQWLLEQYDWRRKHCPCKSHDIKEMYQFRKLVIFKDQYHQFLTKQERKKAECYEHIHLDDAFLCGFFESRKGLFLVTVVLTKGMPADHYIVIDSWRKLIIDSNFEEPISFLVTYNAAGLPDREKWRTVLCELKYHGFVEAYQVYSQNSRFSVS